MSHFGSFEDEMHINFNDGLPSKSSRSASNNNNGFLGEHNGGLENGATRMTSEPAIIFFASKNETFRLSDNFKTFHKKIKNRFHKVIQ